MTSVSTLNLFFNGRMTRECFPPPPSAVVCTGGGLIS